MADKTISIGFKVDGGADGLNTLTMKAGDLRKAMEATVTESKKMTEKLTNMSSIAVTVDSITRTIGDLQSVLGELSDAYAVQIEAETKLQTVMRERMSASEADIQSIKDLCSAQQQLGVIGDEVQLAGAQQMATFLNTRGALETLIPAMNNLTAQQKGLNATSSDTTNIANLMGKAMQGQTAALRRANITLSEAEEKSIKYGTEQERAAALAKVIEKNVGNMNEALAKTPAGQMKQLANASGDAKETLGAMIQQFMPMITQANQLAIGIANVVKMAKAFQLAVGWMQQLPATMAKGAAGVSLLGKSFTDAGARAKMMGIVAAGAMRTLKLAIISTGVGALIWGLGEGLSFIVGKLTETGNAANDASDGIKEMADGQNAENEAMQNATAQIQKHIAELKNWTGSKEEERKKVQELNGTYGELMGTFSTVKDWYDKLTESAELYAQQAVLSARAELVARRLAKSQESLNDFKKKYGDGTPPKGTTGDPKWNIKPIVNTGAIISSAQKNIDDAQKDLADIYAEMAENAKKLKTGKPAGAGAGGGGGGKTAAPELIPEGSIEYYQRKISELEKQIKLAVDPQSMAAMTAQVEEFKKKIARIEFEVWWMPRKDKWDDFYEELQDDAKKDPVTIPVKAKVETPQLTLDTSQFTKGVGTATDDSEALQKNLSRIADVARNAGSAFSSMGQAMESKELNIAGIVAQAIANIVAGYASATTQAGGQLGPWGWAAFALSGLAQTLAMISQIKNVTAFASGGIVSGPTMALVGEYAGASNNPEVIAPLDKLRKLLPDSEGARRIEVTGRLRGSDIELCLANRHRVGMASGRRSKV